MMRFNGGWHGDLAYAPWGAPDYRQTGGDFPAAGERSRRIFDGFPRGVVRLTRSEPWTAARSSPL
jgi:hypothetical protein